MFAYIFAKNDRFTQMKRVHFNAVCIADATNNNVNILLMNAVKCNGQPCPQPTAHSMHNDDDRGLHVQVSEQLDSIIIIIK